MAYVSPGDQEFEDRDALIVRLLQGGDFRALDFIIQRYGAGLRGLIQSIVKNAQTAEDLCHDTLVKAFESHKDCRGAEAFRAWLFRIARNLALDHLRNRSVHARALSFLTRRQKTEATGPILRTSDGPLDTLMKGEFDARFSTALDSLAEHYRTAFVLREMEDMSYEEIADTLGTTVKTVSTRIHRARVQLAELLGPYLDQTRIRRRDES